MSSRIKLNVLGITFSQIQAGAYALVLAEEDGIRRVPIIIGTPEAQSIAIFLEKLNPPRPLTHDLFIEFIGKLNASLVEIFIYRYVDGIFYSEIIFEKDGEIIKLDSRTSDAIALAVRTNAPIYTTEEIMREAGIILEDEIENDIPPSFSEKKKTEISFEQMNLDELGNALNEAISMEDYEKASHIRDIINKRKA